MKKIKTIGKIIAKRIQNIISVFTKKTPSLELCNYFKILNDQELDDFVGENLKREYHFAMASTIVESACKIATERLVHNG